MGSPLRAALLLLAVASTNGTGHQHRDHRAPRRHHHHDHHPRSAALSSGVGAGPTADCPAGPWVAAGRISVMDAPCSAKGVDASADDSDAVERCAQIAANCSIALHFPHGQYYLGRTLALSTATLHSRDGAIALTGDSWGSAQLCGCSGCNDRGTCNPGPVLHFGQKDGGGCCSSVQHLTILGLHTAVHVLNHPGVRMSHAGLTSMSAAPDEAPLVITNGFEYYFQDCDFTGGGRGPDHPAVLLRGANATSYNGTFARTPYVYMVSFDRSEFVMGGVLYQQTAQLDNVRPLAPSDRACHAFCTCADGAVCSQVGAVFFSFYTCYTEASSMPLLTFTSAPGVRKFRVEEVTIIDYGNCA